MRRYIYNSDIRKWVQVLGLFCTVLLCSCGGNVDMLGMFYTVSDGADGRFEQSQEYNSGRGVDTVKVAAEDYPVYIFTDIHVDNTTFNLDTFVTSYLADAGAAPFCLCLGDMINAQGNYPKFMAYIERIRAAGREVYATPGNHDIYFGQWDVYRSYWHTSSYYFVVETPSGKRDLYICLDSSDGTLGAAQRAWLESVLKEKQQENYRHIIAFTHTHLWKRDQSQEHTSNFALEETYDIADLFSRYGVQLVLQGHSHHRYFTRFKNVVYLRLDKMEDHFYNSFYTVLHVGQEYSWNYVSVGPYHDGYNEVRIKGR